MTLEKGQTVYMEETPRNPLDRTGQIIPGVVKKIGRKYYTVEARHLELKYDKETLQEVTDTSAMYLLFPTEQAVFDDRERVRLHAEIRAAFDAFSFTIPLGKLRKIDAILKEDN
jgi:hypothetical protein